MCRTKRSAVANKSNLCRFGLSVAVQGREKVWLFKNCYLQLCCLPFYETVLKDFQGSFFLFFVLFCFVVIVKESVFYAYVTKSSKRLWSQGLWIHRIHILLVNALSEFLPVCKCACHKCCFPLFWGGCLAIQWYSDTFGTTFQDVYAKSNNDNVVLRLPYCCHHRSFTQVDFDNFSGEAKKKKEKKRRLF